MADREIPTFEELSKVIESVIATNVSDIDALHLLLVDCYARMLLMNGSIRAGDLLAQVLRIEIERLKKDAQS